MIQLSEKSRRILRNVYRGLGVTAVSFIFQACYGTPPDYRYDYVLHGSVQSKDKSVPIPGIKVSIGGSDYHDLTDGEGRFWVHVPVQDSYTVTFEDIDGPENGGLFKRHTRNVTAAETRVSLNIDLEEDEE